MVFACSEERMVGQAVLRRMMFASSVRIAMKPVRSGSSSPRCAPSLCSRRSASLSAFTMMGQLTCSEGAFSMNSYTASAEALEVPAMAANR